MHDVGVASEAASRELKIDDLRGFKQLRRVAELLSHLHDNGCDRDRAGNRELHFDDYVLLILLYLFNPMIHSMRSLQRSRSCRRFRSGWGSNDSAWAASARVAACSTRRCCRAWWINWPVSFGRSIVTICSSSCPGKLTLVDSTVIDTLCTVAEAMFLPTGEGRHTHAWRLHLQFDVDHHVPGRGRSPMPKNTGKSDEKSVLRRQLQAGHTYVMDRWYAQFTLWNDIKHAGSSYVCRVRDNSVYNVIEDRALDPASVRRGHAQRSDRRDRPEQEAQRTRRSSDAVDLH